MQHFVCIVQMQAVSSPVPSIVADKGKGTWSVHFDNLCLISPPATSFASALQDWIATFWVFSVKYPQQLHGTCQFIEKYCLGCKCTVSGVVNRLIQKVSADS